MTTSISEDHEHHVYGKGERVPFVPDGDYHHLGANIQTVRRGYRSTDKTVYIQKLITVHKPDQRATLLREARVLHRARHAHVVRLIMTYFIEREPEPHFAIIMELADVKNLEAYLTNQVRESKKRNIPRWFGCLVSVLAHIHGLGIRHRDIKPSNILIRDEQVLLADFGISKMSLGKTMPTTIPGRPRARTEAYCAPEVDDGSTRGRAADIFSLGAIFVEMFIAYCCFSKRQDLEIALTSRGTRSYAKNVDLVQILIDTILKPRPVLWSSTVLSYCKNMLQVERDERPLAEELELAWSHLPPSNEPLTACKCQMVDLESKEEELVELCKKGVLEEVQIFLANGADANVKGALHQATVRGFADIVKTLLQYNVNVNLQDYSKQTALHYAAGRGYEDIIQILLENEADVRVRDEEGQTALQCAAAQGYHNIARMLLSKEADVHARDDEGHTVLHFAARRGHSEVIKLLLDLHCDPGETDSRGRTALHFAAASGSEQAVKLILMQFDQRDVVNNKDEHGRTAAHFAARGHQVGGKYEEIIKLLQEYGADMTLEDCEGHTAPWYTHQSLSDTKRTIY